MYGSKRLWGHPCRAAFLGLQGFTGFGFGVGSCRCLYVVGKICSTVPCVDLFPTVVQWNRVEGSWGRPIMSLISIIGLPGSLFHVNIVCRQRNGQNAAETQQEWFQNACPPI